MPQAGTRKVAEFTADTVEKAIDLGLRTLGVEAEDVEINVLQRPQRKLGLFKSEAVISIAYDEDYIRRKQNEIQIEKYLTLRYAPDGFALKVDPVPEHLHWQLLEVTTHFLIKHHVPGFRRVTRDQVVSEQTGEFHVIFQPEVFELDGVRVSVYMSPPKLEAYFIQYDEGQISQQSIERAISVRNITHGIIPEAVDSIANGTYTPGLPVAIARGERPQDEHAGTLEYQFNPNQVCLSFRGDSSIDFRDIQRLSYVEKDGLLVRKGERRPGKKGWTVTGRDIDYRVEPEPPLPRGTNTHLTEDGLEVRASIGGHIEMHNGLVCIEEAFYVEGDVDYHVGNIKFDGSVLIGGDVQPGFEVKAKGNVEVLGGVDNAVIEAEGDVVVQYGIVSKGQGYVTAKGDVKARHCENVTINARRVYVSSSAVNCELNGRQLVEVMGSPGALVGGVARAKHYVFACHFGSDIGTRTDVIVGDPSEYDALITALKQSIGQKARRRKELLSNYEVTMAATGGQGVSAEQKERLELMVKEADALESELLELRVGLPALKEKRARLAAAKCHVYTKLHEGTFLKLFSAKRNFTEEVKHCTFLFDKQEVRAFPFQYEELPDDMPEDDDEQPEPTPEQAAETKTDEQTASAEASPAGT
jgi:uncharacterized protein (DUF342 family)